MRIRLAKGIFRVGLGSGMAGGLIVFYRLRQGNAEREFLRDQGPFLRVELCPGLAQNASGIRVAHLADGQGNPVFEGLQAAELDIGFRFDDIPGFRRHSKNH